MKPLLVISSGNQTYREYAFRSIAERYAIILLNDKPKTWQAPYVLDFVQVTLTDHKAVIATARALAERYQLAGVFTYDEPFVEIAAEVAKTLNLPYNTPETARLCRDKHLMRQAWDRAQVPSAHSYMVRSVQEAERAIEQIGYPVVLKPRGMAASAGVIRVDRAEDLPATYAVANMDLHPAFFAAARGVLVEEYLDGPEISVESAVIDGNVTIVAMTRKQLGFAPYFEETGHIVAPNQPLPQESAIRDVVIAAHQALGVRMGITHAELRLTQQGPRMIELGARSAGDLIPYLVQLATGIDLNGVGARIAANESPRLEPTRHTAAAIRFLYPSYDAKILRLAVEQTAFEQPWIDQIVFEARPGDVLRLPPRGFLSRLGFVVVTGNSAEECQARIEQALSLIDITLESLSVAA